MKKLLVFGVMAGVFAIAGACWAYPSLLGPTGGANLPVASVIGQKQWSAALDYVGGFSIQDQEVGGTFDFSNTIALRALYGVAPNAEVGVTYNNADIDFTDPIEPANNQSSDLSGVGLNAKYLWPDIVANMPVAAGIVYQNLGDTTVTQLYGVGTRLFSAGSSSAPAIRGTLGANWTNVKYDASDDAIRPFIDVDIAFASGLNITAEYQLKSSKLGDESPVSTLAARYPLNADKSLIGQIGLTNAKFGVLGTEKHTMVLGVNYLFGK